MNSFREEILSALFFAVLPEPKVIAQIFVESIEDGWTIGWKQIPGTISNEHKRTCLQVASRMKSIFKLY